MNRALKGLAAAAVLTFAGCGGVTGQVRYMENGPSAYHLEGEYVEACECESLCACAFANDATFEKCRATVAWHIEKGYYGDSDLCGLTFAVVMTDLGKNVAKNMGNWEGILYLPENASATQKDAIMDFVDRNLRAAFKKDSLKARPSPITFKKVGERREVTIGTVGSVRTAPLKGPGGAVPVIENSPNGLIPREYCAKAEHHTFNDEGVRWDFSGRNAFYGPFTYRNKHEVSTRAHRPRESDRAFPGCDE